MGRYCSYLLPKQAGGAPQILVDKTSPMTGRLRVYFLQLFLKGIDRNSSIALPKIAQNGHSPIFFTAVILNIRLICVQPAGSIVS